MSKQFPQNFNNDFFSLALEGKNKWQRDTFLAGFCVYSLKHLHEEIFLEGIFALGLLANSGTFLLSHVVPESVQQFREIGMPLCCQRKIFTEVFPDLALVLQRPKELGIHKKTSLFNIFLSEPIDLSFFPLKVAIFFSLGRLKAKYSIVDKDDIPKTFGRKLEDIQMPALAEEFLRTLCPKKRKRTT